VAAAIFGIVIVAGIFAVVILFPNILTPNALPGQPSKNPITGSYTVYILIYGHRDRSFFHTDFHANIHLDSMAIYYQYPGDQPSGDTWGDFDKSVTVVVHVTGSQTSGTFNPITTTFTMNNVALGASWGKVITVTLSSGTYSFEADATDQDGYMSSANAGPVVLP
jgi:hypothetical protein